MELSINVVIVEKNQPINSSNPIEEKTIIPEKRTVMLYPNPTYTGQFTVNFAVITANDKVLLSIYDIQGRKIKEIQITDAQTGIDISNETNGVYIASLNINGSLSTHKIIVTK